MNGLIKPLFYIFTGIIFLFGPLPQVSGQNNFNLTTGVGIPELLNIGVRYQFDQLQIGASVGTIPNIDNASTSISSDFYYHFGGFSKKSTRRPWYGKFGFNYFRSEDEYEINKTLSFNLRIGREINISNEAGFQIAIGVLRELSSESIIKKPQPPCNAWCFNFDFDLSIVPSIGIGFFYKI